MTLTLSDIISERMNVRLDARKNTGPMIVSKNIEQSLRERLSHTEGGIKAAAALGGISERAAQKVMRFENVTQPTYDAFCEGLSRLEKAESERKAENERKAQPLNV